MNATFDLTEVYKGQLSLANRGIAIVNQQYIVVCDELKTSETEANVRYTLLTSAHVKLLGDGTAELTKNGKKLILKVQEPGHVVMRTWSTASAKDYDAPIPGTTLVGFETTVPEMTETSLYVFLIPEKVTNKVIFNDMQLKKWNK